jgi:hypothetical protein
MSAESGTTSYKSTIGGALTADKATLKFIAQRVALSVFATSAVVYFLFQKKLLPKNVSKIVSKIFFLPTFP